MLNIFQKLNYKQMVRTFNDQLRIIRILLFADLRDEYSHEYDSETSGRLAAQVVNYLQGEDLEDIYRDSSDADKKVIDHIRTQIPIKANHLLKTNDLVRKLIVYTLRMKAVLRFAEIGESYLEDPEKLRIDNILEEYGAEYPEEASPKLYRKLVDEYIRLPHKTK